MRRQSVPVVECVLPDGRLLVAHVNSNKYWIHNKETNEKEKIDLGKATYLYGIHCVEGECEVVNKPLDDILDPENLEEKRARERVRRRLGKRLGLPIDEELNEIEDEE